MCAGHPGITGTQGDHIIHRYSHVETYTCCTCSDGGVYVLDPFLCSLLLAKVLCVLRHCRERWQQSYCQSYQIFLHKLLITLNEGAKLRKKPQSGKYLGLFCFLKGYFLAIDDIYSFWKVIDGLCILLYQYSCQRINGVCRLARSGADGSDSSSIFCFSQ